MASPRALYHHRTQGRSVEAVHIRGLCSGLEQLGVRVEVVGPPGVRVDPEAGPGTPARRKTTPWGWIARRAPQLLFELLEIGYNGVAIPRLWRACRAARPDLIYERYALFNASAVVVGRLTRTPVILEINDLAGVERERQGKRLLLKRPAAWLERRILRGASGLVAVSGYLRALLIDAGVPPERVRVTPNAVDAERFDPGRVEGRRARARHGLENGLVLGFVGSFARWHAVDLLVVAFAALSREHPDLRLLLVGDGLIRPQVEAQARDLGLADRVVFAGSVPHSQIPEYVAAMDIGIMPASNAFGSPMKVFEYMVMGCPPVAPRLGPLEEAIEDGRTGLLFDPGDARSLAECLRTLVASPERRRQMGAAARRRVLERHLWQHNARAVLELALIAPERGRAAAERSARKPHPAVPGPFAREE